MTAQIDGQIDIFTMLDPPAVDKSWTCEFCGSHWSDGIRDTTKESHLKIGRLGGRCRLQESALWFIPKFIHDRAGGVLWEKHTDVLWLILLAKQRAATDEQIAHVLTLDSCPPERNITQ